PIQRPRTPDTLPAHRDPRYSTCPTSIGGLGRLPERVGVMAPTEHPEGRSTPRAAAPRGTQHPEDPSNPTARPEGVPRRVDQPLTEPSERPPRQKRCSTRMRIA